MVSQWNDNHWSTQWLSHWNGSYWSTNGYVSGMVATGVPMVKSVEW